MQCIQLVRNVHNEPKRPGNSSTMIKHIDVIVNAVLQYLFCHKHAYKVTNLPAITF